MTGKKCKIATVFGGTGFVGRHVVQDLARAGYTVKVATRVPERAYFLRPCGTTGQVVPFPCDYNDPASIDEAVRKADVVVNCIGILFPSRKSAFVRAHIDIPTQIAKSAKKAGVRRLAHISALGVDKGTSRYAKTKYEGEKVVKKAFSDVTILRPGVIFGAGDNFFNMFAELSRYLPCLPLIGGGKTKFQPVYIGDVAGAVMAALTLPLSGDHNPQGRIYELGGPDIVSFRDIYELIFENTQRRRMLVSLPFAVAKIQAAFLEVLPRPLLTRDQVESLKTDNLVSKSSLTLADLGIQATSMETILPTYLARFRIGGNWTDKKRA